MFSPFFPHFFHMLAPLKPPTVELKNPGQVAQVDHGQSPSEASLHDQHPRQAEESTHHGSRTGKGLSDDGMDLGCTLWLCQNSYWKWP